MFENQKIIKNNVEEDEIDSVISPIFGHDYKNKVISKENKSKTKNHTNNNESQIDKNTNSENNESTLELEEFNHEQ